MDLSAFLADVPEPLRTPRLEAVYRLAHAEAGTVPAGRREPGYRFHHGHRVARLALALWETPEVRRARQAAAAPPAVDGVPLEELVWAGALLHDVAKRDVGDDRGGDHAAAGRELVHRRLAGVYGPEACRLVGEIVFRHNKRDGPDDPVWVRVVQDADLLDHFGIMDLWLGAYYHAACGQGLTEFLAYAEGERARSWWEYARRHVRFETARRELERRMATGGAALAQLRREARGQLLILQEAGETPWPSTP